MSEIEGLVTKKSSQILFCLVRS